MQVLEKLSKSNKVTLMWIPGHQGIPGNEEADRLAKEGAVEVPPNQFAAIPFSVGKNVIKKQLEQRHRARWTTCTGYRQSKVLMRYPLSSRANELLAMNKFEAQSCCRAVNRPHKTEGASAQTWIHRRARMPTVWT
jgi:hypothetical protein